MKAFDHPLCYRQEVAVNWREVPGSKLIRSKLDVITTSANMLRDMLCVKLCYLLGVWGVTPASAGLSKALSKEESDSAFNKKRR